MLNALEGSEFKEGNFGEVLMRGYFAGASHTGGEPDGIKRLPDALRDARIPFSWELCSAQALNRIPPGPGIQIAFYPAFYRRESDERGAIELAIEKFVKSRGASVIPISWINMPFWVDAERSEIKPGRHSVLTAKVELPLYIDHHDGLVASVGREVAQQLRAEYGSENTSNHRIRLSLGGPAAAP